MKNRLLCTVLAVAFAAACIAGQKPGSDIPVQSGVSLDSLAARDPRVIENLEVLCRVWGYAKYHHPAFEREEVDADAELFGLLRRTAEASPRIRNKILYEWVKGLGDFERDTTLGEEPLAGCVTLADLSWTGDAKRLGRPLSDLLQRLRYARRTPGANRYMKLRLYIGNPDMSGECTAGSLDDCGYRLLYLFRFWNVIEYYAPNRNITDRDWSEIPAAHIPAFIRGGDSPYPFLLQHELCDTHAAGWSGGWFGYNRLPVETNSAAGRTFVTQLLSAEGPLHIGDEILSVDGHDRQQVRHATSRCESYSNPEGLDRMTDTRFCSSHRDTATVEILRRGERIVCKVPTMPATEWYAAREARLSAPDGLRMLDDGIGYMTALHYTAAEAPRIIDRFRDTETLIVDMRCYPQEFMVFDFIGRYFLPEPTPFARMLVPTGTLPGTYRYCDIALTVGRGFFSMMKNPDCYKGRVIVLVDAQTQSQSEYTTMAFQATPRCTVVGNRTAGADGDVSRLFLPTGMNNTYFSGLGVYYPDGTNTQRTGVRIDIPVQPTVEGLQAGRDEILERALEIARSEPTENGD